MVIRPSKEWLRPSTNWARHTPETKRLLNHGYNWVDWPSFCPCLILTTCSVSALECIQVPVSRSVLKMHPECLCLDLGLLLVTAPLCHHVGLLGIVWCLGALKVHLICVMGQSQVLQLKCPCHHLSLDISGHLESTGFEHLQTAPHNRTLEHPDWSSLRISWLGLSFWPSSDFLIKLYINVKPTIPTSSAGFSDSCKSEQFC